MSIFRTFLISVCLTLLQVSSVRHRVTLETHGSPSLPEKAHLPRLPVLQQFIELSRNVITSEKTQALSRGSARAEAQRDERSHFDTVRYTQLAAASAPISTVCSNFLSDKPFYRAFANQCGIAPADGALDTHIDRVWNLITDARQELQTSSPKQSTLHIFVAPEWLFRRYPGATGADYAPPLSFHEMQHILTRLQSMMQDGGLGFEDWLVVPGSIYWGIPYQSATATPSRGSANSTDQYAVFNTVPVFYNGKLAYAQHKDIQADFLSKAHERWGFDLLRSGASVSEWLSAEDASAKLISNYLSAGIVRFKDGRLTEPEGADIMSIGGLVVGLDICKDHDARRAGQQLLKSPHSHFDIQLLVSSGMTFDGPGASGHAGLGLMLREGGVAVSADGAHPWQTSSRLFVRLETGEAKWNEGPVHTSAKKSGKLLSIHSDFEQRQARLKGFWPEGDCEDDADVNQPVCICQALPHEFFKGGFPTPSTRQEIERASVALGLSGSYQAMKRRNSIKDLCTTETGNWHRLKLWKAFTWSH